MIPTHAIPWSKAMEIVPLVPADGVEITTLVDNQIDALIPGDEQVCRHPFDRSVRNPFLEGGGPGLATLRAEHGFSALVTVNVGGQRHTLLFDTGVSPDGMVANMDRLQVEPKDVEAIVLSHGHADHTAGLAGLAERLGRANLPVLAHRKAYSKRRMAPPQGDIIPLPPPSRAALEGAGFELVDAEDPSLIFQESVLLTGEVPRVTTFEQGFPFFQRETERGWEPEPHLMDDQALVVNIRGKGLLVLTGCGHAGIVNIVTRAREISGVQKIYAILGGFHLPGAFFEPLIPPTVDALRNFAPDVIVPAHCTSYKAQMAIAAAMPEAYVHNAVGTSYLL